MASTKTELRVQPINQHSSRCGVNPTTLSTNSPSLSSSLPSSSSSSSSPDSSNQFSVGKFFKLMRYERLRLITYLLYGHKWPKMDTISPAELAKAGFFYFHDDSVQCAFCRGVIRDWNAGLILYLSFIHVLDQI